MVSVSGETTKKGVASVLSSPSARDELTFLFIKGYMFPQTKHVETFVQLLHKKPDTHLEVALDCGNSEVESSLFDLEARVK